MITQRGLASYLQWSIQAYPLADGESVPLHSSLGFDLTTTSLFCPLLVGQSVVIVPEGHGTETLGVSLLQRGNFSFVKMTPSHLESLNQWMPTQSAAGSTHMLILGGEVLPAESLALWQKQAPTTRIFNSYGPTEMTVGCCSYEVKKEVTLHGSVPIGKPIANMQIYILDRNYQLAPVGVPGELYIGGIGGGRGYFNCPDLTAECFIPHPFSRKVGERLYRTGDLGRYTTTRNIEYLGQLYNQIKLRGYRIELEEIEKVLSQHSVVSQSVVVQEEDTGNKRLVAYVVGEPFLASEDLKRSMQVQLPAFMLPSFFVIVDELPLTANGKVNRRALSACTWEKILHTRPIGVKDDFFASGGHSLLAVLLFTQIRKLFGKNLPMAAFFEEATIERLTSLLRQQSSSIDTVSSSPLVHIQPQGNNPPFFCVYPLGGNVLCYFELARQLGVDQPFYGLQVQGLQEDKEPLTTIEDMASLYLKAIEGVQPDGPYILGGWSMGGVIAFDMAQQLWQKRRKSALVVLIDSWHPASSAATKKKDELLLLGKVISDLLSLPHVHFEQNSLQHQLLSLLEQAKKAHILPTDFGMRQIQHLLHLYTVHHHAVHKYQPEIYHGPVLLFQAQEKDPEIPYSQYTSRCNVLRGDIQVHISSGNHWMMLKHPHVETVTSKLRQIVNVSIDKLH